MKRALTIAALAGLLASTAAAQAPNPVMVHYRAYTAAMAQNDYATAEQEAGEALAASEARDGDGGRTAVLALNLANARMSLGRGADAMVPAQRAFNIAAARGVDSGVDPLMARLVLARAEIFADMPDGMARAVAALAEARDRPDLAAEVYDTASLLTNVEFAQQHWASAREYGELALSKSGNAGMDPRFARGYADVGIAAAIVMNSSRDRIRRADAIVARERLEEAVRVFGQFAISERPHGTLTRGQRAYAQAMVWNAALRSKIYSDALHLPEAERDELESDAPSRQNGPVELGAGDPRPLCAIRVTPAPTPHFPREMLNRGGIGSVVMYFEADHEGQVTHKEVAAAVGQAFADAVASDHIHWSVERAPDAVAGCRYPAAFFQTVNFIMAP